MADRIFVIKAHPTELGKGIIEEVLLFSDVIISLNPDCQNFKRYRKESPN